MGGLYLSMVRLSVTFAVIIGTAVLLGRLADALICGAECATRYSARKRRRYTYEQTHASRI